MGEETKPVKESVKDNTEGAVATPLREFRDPFTITLMINDNVVSRKYFRVPDYNIDALECVELKEVLDKVVQNIQSDLEYKSRIYQYYTAEGPVKLTGFLNEIPADIPEEDRHEATIKVISEKHQGDVVLPNGQVIRKEYIEYPGPYEDKYGDYERPADGEVMMSFILAFRDKPVYIRQWDGNVYPKHVRHSLDLTNSDEAYKDKDPNSLNFVLSMNRYMSEGRPDLLKQAVEMITGVLDKSNLPEYSEGEYTRYDYYETVDSTKTVPENIDPTVKPIEVLGHIDIPVESKEYFCSTYNKPYINGWRDAVAEKTRKYERWVNNDIQPWLFEKIEKMAGRNNR